MFIETQIATALGVVASARDSVNQAISRMPDGEAKTILQGIALDPASLKTTLLAKVRRLACLQSLYACDQERAFVLQA